MDAQAISLVRTSFKAVGAVDGGPDRLTSSFYAILFADNPVVRELFPSAMNAQRERLVAAIAHVVDNLDDLESTLPFLAQLGRDHCKFGIDDSHYAAVGTALITALQRFAGAEMWTDDVDAAWRDAISVITGVMMEAAHEEAGAPVVGAEVVEHIEVLRGLSIVRLQLDDPLQYAAGQYVSVQTPHRPQMWRYMSPAIPSNASGQLEFHVRRVSGGWVSPAIVSRTQPRDRWVVGSPLGALGVDGANGRDMLMVASGTGIAPLRAQIMDMSARSRNPRVHLFMGGAHPCDLYDYAAMSRIAATNPWLTVVAVSETDESPWWAGNAPHPVPMLQRNTAPVHIGRFVAEYGSWADHDIQVVGSPAMVKTTSYSLRVAGIPTEQIRHDPLR